MGASLISIGSYVPNKLLTNKELEKIVDTTDEWIMKRTGIKERYIAQDERNSSMGTKAAQIAIDRASIDKNEIDMVICATISPDFLCMPSTACLIASNLGLNGTPAFDISAACSGFIYLLSIADAFIKSGKYKNVLIIGSERTSSIIDFTDRNTCVLFGDGAGAAIVSCREENQIIDINIASDGAYYDYLMTPGGGSNMPCSQKVIDERLAFMKMRGNEVFKLAVKTLANDVGLILSRNNLSPKDIKYFIPHQANLRIIKAVGELLDFDESQIVITVDKYGNTSAASIPMAMNLLYEQGKLKKGDLLLLDAFGGGLTWGSSLLYFNG